MPDFSRRSTANEMMDDFGLGNEIIYPIMDELEVINKRLGGYHVFLNALKKIKTGPETTICDWGCGGGDSLRAIALWGRKKHFNLSLTGIDATASAVTYAQKKSASYPEINYVHADVAACTSGLKQFDIIVSSLFTHHFPDKDWIALIKKMTDNAGQAVIVNDLHRHWLAYYSIGILTRLFSRSVMVRNDSQLSVLRSFKRAEIKDLLARAGISNYSLRWMWAFRWQLIIFKA